MRNVKKLKEINLTISLSSGGEEEEEKQGGWDNWGSENEDFVTPAQDAVTSLTKPINSWAASHQWQDDLSQLDIKSSKVSHHSVAAAAEDDLLADLEPTIAKGSGLLDLLEEKVKKSYVAPPPVSKFTVDDDSHEEELEGGWGDDDGGWSNNDLKLNKND